MFSIASYVKTIILAAYIAGVFDTHMSDQSLTNQFKKHEADFNKLVMMANKDKKLTKINPYYTYLENDERWPRPESKLDLSEERWNEYRKLFKSTGVNQGIMRMRDRSGVSLPSGAIFFIATTKRDSIKGYVYSETPLSPLLNSLDSLGRPSDNCPVYKRLNDRWYLFYERD
jgi:hypothetical protein